MRNPPPDFDIGDYVTIKPMEDCPARVIAMELDRDGWTVVVRYFQNGDAKTLKAFPDEIEHQMARLRESSIAEKAESLRTRNAEMASRMNGAA